MKWRRKQKFRIQNTGGKNDNNIVGWNKNNNNNSTGRNNNITGWNNKNTGCENTRMKQKAV